MVSKVMLKKMLNDAQIDFAMLVHFSFTLGQINLLVNHLYQIEPNAKNIYVPGWEEMEQLKTYLDIMREHEFLIDKKIFSPALVICLIETIQEIESKKS